MKTYQKRKKEIKRNWHFLDADGQVLGRLSTKIAGLLMGKNKVNYTPHMDDGDYVVVTNAKGIVLTGKKEKQKVYRRHSGYPGGFKEVSASKYLKENPKKIIELAVLGMLPDNRLKKLRISRLNVYNDSEHKYTQILKKQNEENQK
jgi:large subunit ribosomal protein L13